MTKKLQKNKNSLGVWASGFLALASFTSFNATAQYCTPVFPSGCSDGDQINNFTVTGNGLNFSNPDSGCSSQSYGDFTTQTIAVTAGENYTFTTTHGYQSQRVRIWADFNNNQTFEDSELLAQASSTGSEANTTTTGTFTIPLSTNAGSYRIRVATRYNNYPIACNTQGFGEAEDYTLVVAANTASCLPILSATASNVTVYTATLDWTHTGGNANSYKISYGPTGFNADSGAIITATGTSTTLTGLDQNTSYQYYVKAVCGVNDESTWAGPYTFTTSIAPLTTPWTETLINTTIPLGWSSQNGFYITNSTVTLQNSTQNYFVKNLYTITSNTASATGGVTTRQIGPILDGDHLSFDYAVKQYSNEKTSVGNIKVSLTTDNGTTYQELFTINHGNENLPWKRIEPVDLQNFVGETIRIKIECNSDTSMSTNDYYVGLDNFSIGPVPACDTPYGLNAEQVNVTTTNISWTAENTTNFKVVYGVQGFDHTAATPIDVTETNYTLNNLTTNTNYQYYVKSVCGVEESEWVGPRNFKVGYCQSVPSSNDGNGITSVTIGETTFPVADVTQYTHPTAINVTKGVETTGSIIFETGYTYHTHIWVDLNKDGVFDNTTEKLYSGESTNVVPTTLATNFTIPAGTESGEYRFRIGTADDGQSTPNPCYSGTYGVTIDGTLNITDALSNETLDLAELKLYPNPTSDVLNIAYKNEVAKVTIFDIQGRQVATHNINATNATINVNDLATGTYLIKLETSTNEVSTLKFIKK